MWEKRTEFLAPGFSLTQASCWSHLGGNQWTRRIFLFAAPYLLPHVCQACWAVQSFVPAKGFRTEQSYPKTCPIQVFWGVELVIRSVVPTPSSKSVPASVGCLVLPMLTSHLLGAAGPLDTVLGGRWVAIWGRPAGWLGRQPGSFAPARCLGLQDLRACAMDRRTELCPQAQSLLPAWFSGSQEGNDNGVVPVRIVSGMLSTDCPAAWCHPGMGSSLEVLLTPLAGKVHRDRIF